ncbi:yceI-like domain protein [Asticcacaulis biprosthecium C19]|uniref:YceI-like domain protein n=1 Tax=Asticcacaulis biprosthecium C19 TaxID=715226 RepID=F4QIL7_9CAUL|nr:YceI family protein [Asticcacaulis biprosthecium]EGF93006.1 yceI-like domain protein [Asticcacaulis biprosthecium C19]
MSARLSSLIFLLAATAWPVAAAETYTIEPKHSSAQFTYEHFGLSHPTGKVMGAAGTIVLDSDDPARSSVTASLDMATLTTALPEFDDLLKGEKYFDIARFPKATFVSTLVEPTGDKTAKVTGDLTVHGITQSVVLDVTFNRKAFNPALFKTGVGFTATTQLSRKAFGLGNLAPVVGDDIGLVIEVEAY